MSFCLEVSSSSRCFATIDFSLSSSSSKCCLISLSLCCISNSCSFITPSYSCCRSFFSNSKLFSKLNCSFRNSASKRPFSFSKSFFNFSISLRCSSSDSRIGLCFLLITSIFCLCCCSILFSSSSYCCFSFAVSSMSATSTSSLVI